MNNITETEELKVKEQQFFKSNVEGWWLVGRLVVSETLFCGEGVIIRDSD